MESLLAAYHRFRLKIPHQVSSRYPDMESLFSAFPVCKTEEQFLQSFALNMADLAEPEDPEPGELNLDFCSRNDPRLSMLFTWLLRGEKWESTHPEASF